LTTDDQDVVVLGDARSRTRNVGKLITPHDLDPFAGVLSAEDRLKVLEGYSKVPHAAGSPFDTYT
jgi:hypothetical protein